jgi:hypothetical protein
LSLFNPAQITDLKERTSKEVTEIKVSLNANIEFADAG